MSKKNNNPLDNQEFLPNLQQYCQGENVDFMQQFAGTMLLLHQMIISIDSYFQSLGTSKGRFILLARLLLTGGKDGESIAVLRSYYPISYAALTGVLDTLEKDGMIERCRNPGDRRKVNIRLTDEGRSFIIGFLPGHVANVAKINSALSAEEGALLYTSLQKLIDGFQQVTETIRSES